MRHTTAYGEDVGPLKPPEFHSQEERDRWQIATYGHVRNAFREPDEPQDNRPPIDRRPFWTNESEQVTYEHAVATNPRRPNELPSVYIARLAAIAQGRLQAKRDAVAELVKSKSMPPKQRAMTDGEWNERNNELQKQREDVTK